MKLIFFCGHCFLCSHVNCRFSPYRFFVYVSTCALVSLAYMWFVWLMRSTALGCTEWHTTHTLNKPNPLKYITDYLGSTQTIIYNLFCFLFSPIIFHRSYVGWTAHNHTDSKCSWAHIQIALPRKNFLPLTTYFTIILTALHFSSLTVSAVIVVVLLPVVPICQHFEKYVLVYSHIHTYI